MAGKYSRKGRKGKKVRKKVTRTTPRRDKVTGRFVARV